jgi:phenylpyruvate tautomerase PptA (4-oxalocrotonate tautomerase family)
MEEITNLDESDMRPRRGIDEYLKDNGLEINTANQIRYIIESPDKIQVAELIKGVSRVAVANELGLNRNSVRVHFSYVCNSKSMHRYTGAAIAHWLLEKGYQLESEV